MNVNYLYERIHIFQFNHFGGETHFYHFGVKNKKNLGRGLSEKILEGV